MNYKHIQEIAANYVVDYFKSHVDNRLAYHNLEHTLKVVEAAQQIANHYQLGEQDFFVVTIAAYFHDTGYHIDLHQHEARGADLADAFLEQQGVGEEIRTSVRNAIMSTKMPQSPKTLNDKILCDADLFHLGSTEYREKAKLVHQEVNTFCKGAISKNDWRKKDIQFLESHHYHTDYCNLLLNDQKQKNLEKLKSKLKEDKEEKEEHLDDAHSQVIDFHMGKKERPEKGIETMFRITSANNQRLSDMADNKAHILITVNSIILSLVVSLLLRKLDSNDFLMIPTFILLLMSLSCVVVSILSTRPSIPEGVFTPEDIKQKSVNLLFFGNFYKMPLERYTEGMIKVMNDKDFLYGTLIRDVYAQGVVLGRKYKLIRLAYNIFMFGLIISILAYMVAFLGFSKN